MRKNVLSLSIAAMIGSMGIANASVLDPSILANAALMPLAGAAVGAPTPATQLQLNAGGVGHALILPYYTAQSGNATVLSVVNTDPTNGKAVKVRFRGGSNSDDVLDFQVFLSPNDQWSAVVTKNPTTGYAQLTTNDKSCTVPALTAGVAQSFIDGRLPSYATATEKANHTSEGYVEIFNMADIPVVAATTSLYQSILHTSGVPRNCAAAAVQTTPLTDTLAPATVIANGFMAPSTGLFGNWTIINVAQTTTFSGGMTAIRAVDAGGNDAIGNYVFSPQSGTAATTTLTVDNVTADPLFRSVGQAFLTMDTDGTGGTAIPSIAIPAAYYDLPDMSTPYVPTGVASTAASPLAQAFRVTDALAVKSISNEYSTDPTVTASTDWNFSMPTRRYSVGVVYGTSAAAAVRRFSSVAAQDGGFGTVAQLAPFAAVPRSQVFYTGNTSLSGDRICVTAAGQKFYDRDESSKTSGAVFSPGSVATFQFCGETSVTTFGANASVLGATLATQSTGASAFVSGWGVVTTTTASNNVIAGAADSARTVGLPIVGSSFIKLINPSASTGTSGTYGITSGHRFTK
ncbi:MAG: cell surface protein [Betaproteobacteria bacterium]|nr:cell surface protein [Betaproteobacteria bacterium]